MLQRSCSRQLFDTLADVYERASTYAISTSNQESSPRGCQHLSGEEALVPRFERRKKEFDEVLVASARQQAGINGCVTNLPTLTPPVEVVIDACHQLFNAKASLRMAKTDLKARPIYHRAREKIATHLTSVIATVAVSMWVQEQIGLSIKRFVRMLAAVRDAIKVLVAKLT